MRSLLSFTASLFVAVSVFALPQKVHLMGQLQSSRGISQEVHVDLVLKSESATKAKYQGRAHLQDVLSNDQHITLTMNLSKGKSEGVIDLYNGHIAFDAKAVFAMEVGQQLQLKYSEFRQDSALQPPCVPMNDPWCRPGQDMPRLVDRGVLNLTVVEAQ